MKFLDKDEFEEMIISTIPVLRNFIKRIVKDDDDAEDILQEALITALSKLHTFQEPYNIISWLKTIAKNRCINLLKKKSRFLRLENIPNYENYLLYDEKDDAVRESDERYNKVIQTINTISSPLRDVMRMKYFTNHTIDEISRLLKIPEGTVKRRLFDARNIIRKEYKMNQKRYPCMPPEIQIIPKKIEGHEVVRKGFGLVMASVFNVGDVEIIDRYSYPGGILNYRAKTTVRRKVKLMGENVFEVKVDFEKAEGMEDRLLYYRKNENSIDMVQRIFTTDSIRVETNLEDELKVSPLAIKVGESKDCFAEAVDVKIGPKLYENAIREVNSYDDYHGRCYIEEYWSEEGRQVILKEYIGENWKMGGYVNWKKLEHSPYTEFRGEKFRLEAEYILIDHYTLEG